MNNLDNVFLFMQSDDALEALHSGDAKLSSGGIRKKDGTLLELAKPAQLSVAELLSLIDGKTTTKAGELSLEDELKKRDIEIEHINQIAFLNNRALQNVYTLTYEGFKQTLIGINDVKDQVEKLSQSVSKHYFSEELESALRLMNYMKTDYGNLCSNKYDVTNGNIAEHLDEICAFISRLEYEVNNGAENSQFKIEIVINLFSPFANIVRRFSALYYYANGFLPGNFEGWIRVITKSGIMNNLFYYVNLYFDSPFRTKVKQIDTANKAIQRLCQNIEFDVKFIGSHTKEEYQALPNTIIENINSNRYYLDDNGICIFI